jgi:hypothetical protein
MLVAYNVAFDQAAAAGPLIDGDKQSETYYPESHLDGL